MDKLCKKRGRVSQASQYNGTEPWLLFPGFLIANRMFSRKHQSYRSQTGIHGRRGLQPVLPAGRSTGGSKKIVIAQPERLPFATPPSQKAWLPEGFSRRQRLSFTLAVERSRFLIPETNARKPTHETPWPTAVKPSFRFSNPLVLK